MHGKRVEQRARAFGTGKTRLIKTTAPLWAEQDNGDARHAQLSFAPDAFTAGAQALT